MNSRALLQQIEPQLIKAFSDVPEYGSLGFIVHLHQQKPVRIEWTGSITKKLDKQGDTK